MVPGSIEFVAGGRCTVAGGALTAQSTTGGILFARTGAGVFTATLSDGGIDATEMLCSYHTEGAAMATITTVHTSDTVKTLTVFDNAGMALDNTNFGWYCYRISRP